MENEREMKDHLIRATAMGGEIRAFALTSHDTLEEARKIHGTSPTATAALGRLLSAGLMLGSDMKDDRDLITLRIDCEGPVKGLLVTADHCGRVKGYASVPQADLPPNALGKLDVGGLLGPGVLSCIKDLGLKEPYAGRTDLVSGEIAEDITYYLANSEQIPSAVALGVLVDTDGSVRHSGGYMLELMPGASDETAELLEERVAASESVTTLLEKGMSPTDILEMLLSGMDPVINEEIPCSYYCGCNRERVSGAILGMGRKDLREIIEDGEDIEVGCQFCGRKYIFTPGELSEMLSHADAALQCE